jgi:site-specific recombinase XerC
MMKKYLTRDEQNRLLFTLKQCAGGTARRDDALIRLLIASGMRIGECLRLSIGDAVSAIKSGYLFIPKEYRKGRVGEKRDHEILMTNSVRLAVRDLLTLRDGAPLEDALVVSRKHGALTVRAFQFRMAYWAKLAALPAGVSPHWLRHTRGQNVYNNTTSIDRLGAVKAALGHASIRSSEIYARMAREEVDAAMREVDEKMNGKPRLRLADLRRQHDLQLGVAA